MPNPTPTRQPTNVSLDAALLRDAKSLRINISRAAEDGVRAALAKAKAEQWQRDNAEAIDSSNGWVEANGLPLDPHRQF